MRDVPYFPCYASNLIANKHYRMMTLIERGLWITMYLECWSNVSLPKDKASLAKYLGLQEGEVDSALSPNLMSFFEARDGELVNIELELYRVKVLENRQKKKEGGIEGARRKKLKRSMGEDVSKPSGNPEGLPQGSPDGALGYINSNQFKLAQFNSNQLLDKKSKYTNDDWVDGYDKADGLSYLEQSKGS